MIDEPDITLQRAEAQDALECLESGAPFIPNPAIPAPKRRGFTIALCVLGALLGMGGGLLLTVVGGLLGAALGAFIDSVRRIVAKLVSDV